MRAVREGGWEGIDRYGELQKKYAANQLDWECHTGLQVAMAHVPSRPLLAITPCLFLTRPFTAAFLSQRIEEGYPSNPYHCRTHAADVLRSLHVLLNRGRVMSTVVASARARMAQATGGAETEKRAEQQTPEKTHVRGRGASAVP